MSSTYIQFSVIYVCNSFDFIVPSATFNNISAISWQPVVVVEEAQTRRELSTMSK
jgi:hypothetical protein